MKEWVQKISVILVLAACELLLGILLLVNPVGLTGFVIMALGVLLMILGVINLFQYIRLPLAEAAKTWNLATGAGLLAIGLSVLGNQTWMQEMVGTQTTLYGLVLMIAAFMKLQITVDALRYKYAYWYLMAISFVATGVLAALLFGGVFAENVVWIVTGIAMIALALLDAAYFILGRRKEEG